MFLLISINGILPTYAQRVLTLDDCLRIALRENLNIKSADNNNQSAKFAHDEIGKTNLPLVKVEGKASHSPHSKNFGYDPAITDGGQYSAQFVVQEQLFDGGARSTKLNQLQVDIERTQAERNKVERDLRYDVTISFFNVLQTQDELSLQQQHVNELTSYLELVKRLSLGGVANYTDVLKTEVTFENAKVALQKTIQENVDAKFYLAGIIGTPEDTSFSINGSLEAPDSSIVCSLLYDAPIDSVHNTELKIAGFNLRRSLFDVDIARSERLPTISLSGDVGLLTSGDNLKLPSGERVSVLGYSIGISIDNLLFNWGTTDLLIQQQHLAAENMRLNYEQQRRSLQTELKRLRSQIKNTIDQLNFLTHTLKKAEDNYTLTKAQYAGGGTTALEVLTAEQMLSENRLTEIQTRADLKKLIAKIEQLNQ